MTVEFEHRLHISAPVEVVFDLSLDVDARMASMTDSGERAIGGVTSGLIGLGEEVTWEDAATTWEGRRACESRLMLAT